MSAPVEANYYDGLTSKPKVALVQLREPGALELEVEGERILWPLEHDAIQWERSATQLRIMFGEHPRRVLIVRDKAFVASFVKRMQVVGRRGMYDRAWSLARRGPVLFLLGTIALLVAGYFWVLPFAAERLALLLPDELDRQLGKAASGTMVMGMDEDSLRSAALQRFGDKLQLGERFQLKYHLVESDQVNAFALPGGDIVVFSGIVEGMDEPGQLAALLAHEATHVEERHSTRLLVRQAAGYIFLSALLGDVNAVVALVAENADNLRNLSYSRGLETDADEHGMERMHAAQVDPEGMVRLLELLEREAEDMPSELGFLSSHPLTTERIALARRKAAEWNAGSDEKAPMDPELKRLFDAVKQVTANSDVEAAGPDSTQHQ